MSTEWWQALLDGSIGALIGLVGLGWVFISTMRHERRSYIEARVDSDARSRDGRTSQSVADLISGANGLALELARNRRADGLAGVAEFSAAAQQFVAREIRDHRQMAEWVLDRTRAIVGPAEASLVKRRDSILPPQLRSDGPHPAEAIAVEIGEVVGSVLAWHIGVKDISLFEEQLATSPHS